MEAMYLVGQTVLYTGVLYFMAYFAVDAGKFFWFMLFSFLNFLFFTYFGMYVLLASLSCTICQMCLLLVCKMPIWHLLCELAVAFQCACKTLCQLQANCANSIVIGRE